MPKYHVDLNIPVLKAAAGREPPPPGPEYSIGDIEAYAIAGRRALEARKELQEKYLRDVMVLFVSLLSRANLFANQLGESPVRIYLEFREAEERSAEDFDPI